MPEQSTPTPRARVSADPRIVIVDGYGISLAVSRGHLVIKDGIGRYRQERRFSRLDAKSRDGIARLIIMAETGFISLEVIKWCKSLGIAISQVSFDGSIGVVSPGARSSDARIVKQQVLAGEGMPNENRGLTLTRALLTEKLTGQRNIARDMFHADTPVIDAQIESLAKAGSLRLMLATEGNTAIPYWRLWKDRVFVPWELDALRYIPGHWARFGSRSGTKTIANGYSSTSNRDATNFINACLNYGYKIAETEALYACHILGLHPGLGVGHGIHDGKPGMALDIVEPLRPIVDRTVLSYLDYGNGIPFDDTGNPAYIGQDNAMELADGTCRLLAPMTSRLATAVSMAVAAEAVRYAELAIKILAPNVRKGSIPRDTRTGLRIAPGGKLAADITVTDLIPDAVWNAVYPFIPVRHASGITVDERSVLAGIVAHEIYGVSWPGVEVLAVDCRTCQSRLTLWEKTGVWTKIRGVVTRPGVSGFTASAL